MIILHSHGGLGNQIFQILAAKLLSFQFKVNKIQIYHNDKYNHSFKLSDKFYIYDKAKGLILFLSKLRLPKFFFRLNLSDKEYLNFYRFFFLDGYFQDISFYQKFPREVINSNLSYLRKLLLVTKLKRKNKKLYHLRLGDFFLNRELAKNYAINYIKKCENLSHLITNQEDLLSSNNLNKLIKYKKIKIIKTGKIKATDLLNFMASYDEITSNSSTLAFWAAVLGESKLNIKSKRLMILYKFLLNK